MDRFAANVDEVGLLIGDGLAVSVDVVVGFGRAAAVVAREAIVLGADLARKAVDVVVAGRAGAFAVAVLAVVGLLTVLWLGDDDVWALTFFVWQMLKKTKCPRRHDALTLRSMERVVQP